MGYGQCNGDYTVFYKHSNRKITIMAVYLDDIIITGNDEAEIVQLKRLLCKAFEVKGHNIDATQVCPRSTK